MPKLLGKDLEKLTKKGQKILKSQYSERNLTFILLNYSQELLSWTRCYGAHVGNYPESSF